MKKKYIICFLVCALVLSGAYIGSYRLFSNDTGKNKISVEEGNIQVLSTDELIKGTTQLIVETYNTISDVSEKEVMSMPAVYLGLSRNGMLEKLDEYMNNLSIKDLEDGLISYDLLYFSTDYVMLRKTYSPNEEFNKYYIKLNRGQITVYYSDQKTVYEYTDININQLPESLQAEIINGIQIKDEKELYDFLENYST